MKNNTYVSNNNMFLKIVVITILFVIILSSFFNSVQASENTNKELIDVKVPAAVVIDSESGRVLFDKNANERRAMASLTKIMTSILLVENCDMDELIEIPAAATWIGGSEAGLKKGDKVSAKSLLYGMMLPSGNDCAYTVGLHIGGTIENFANMMTEKAKQIGCVDTSFANPHGLDNEDHYTTAREMALITRYAISNKHINQAMNTTSTTVNFGSFSKLLSNTNALLRTYNKADGGKTGFTNNANRCIVVTASEGESRYIGVVLGAETTQIRFGTAKDILEASFKRYQKMDVSKYLNFYINIPIEKGNIKTYERKYQDELSLPLTQEEYDGIYIKQSVVQKIIPPMDVGAKIGDIQVFIEDEKIYEKELFLEENIYKKGVVDYIKEALRNMFAPIEVI